MSEDGYKQVATILGSPDSTYLRRWLEYIMTEEQARIVAALLPCSHSFGGVLSPVYCRRGCTRPVSYYALFEGWLLLSQPPGCWGTPTSFYTRARAWGP